MERNHLDKLYKDRYTLSKKKRVDQKWNLLNLYIISTMKLQDKNGLVAKLLGAYVTVDFLV
jgi:hypothetical protein